MSPNTLHSVIVPVKCKAVNMLIYFIITLAICITIQTEGRVIQGKRIRRQDCADGTYQHEGRTCCLCAAGQKLTGHCTSQTQTQCDFCESGREYRSHPNDLKNCEPCTSCSQPNANLEVDSNCTSYKDAVCKCQENHYCTSGTKPCKICEPCQVCGSEGVKVACSATNNTICNSETEGTTKILIGILVPLFMLLAGGMVAVFCWRKRKAGSKKITDGRNGATSGETQPLQPIQAVELSPHIPAIAEVMGWTDMRNLSMKSGVTDGIIESCKLDHPQDTLEQTIHLLRIWGEREGRDASNKLIQYLQEIKRKQKAEKVVELLCGGS